MGGLESLVGALPEPLRLQLAKVDDLLGVQHSGALALLAILLLILLISLSTISSGTSGPMPSTSSPGPVIHCWSVVMASRAVPWWWNGSGEEEGQHRPPAGTLRQWKDSAVPPGNAASCLHSHPVATETLSLKMMNHVHLDSYQYSCRQLLHGVAPETVTSMKESESQASLTKASGAPVSYALVDFPGHERLRG